MLFEWSSPERRSADRILPIIPNEIYLHIFELLVPHNEPEALDPWDLQLLARVGGVCRLFANVCLPRIFEHLRFFGVDISDDSHTESNIDPLHQLLSLRLLTQIASNGPAALTAARGVRIFDLDNGYIDDNYNWHRGLTPKYFLHWMSHMTNIRRFVLRGCFVDVDHWRIIASLPLLEELCFILCEFLSAPSDARLGMVRLGLSLLEVTGCVGRFEPMAPIDPRGLRTLIVDLEVASDIDWIPQSALTELSIYNGLSFLVSSQPWEWEIAPMRDIVMQLPDSIQTLSLYFHYLTDAPADQVIRHMFDCPAWTNFRRLRSLRLAVCPRASRRYFDVLATALDGIVHHDLIGLQSLILENYDWDQKLPSLEIVSILRDKVGPHSSLTSIEILGTALCLVDGEWLEVQDSDSDSEA